MSYVDPNVPILTAVDLSKIWNRGQFTRLYRDVLELGYSVRVIRICDDGSYMIETYAKTGWWIFGVKHPIHMFLLDPNDQTIRALPPGMPI